MYVRFQYLICIKKCLSISTPSTYACVCFLQSKSGPILIAINPFKDVQLYGNDFFIAYKQKLCDSPHVYAIADTAYNEMMRAEVNKTSKNLENDWFFSFRYFVTKVSILITFAVMMDLADDLNQSIIIRLVVVSLFHYMMRKLLY